MNGDETRLITGSAAPNLRIYSISSNDSSTTSPTVAMKDGDENNQESEEVYQILIMKHRLFLTGLNRKF